MTDTHDTVEDQDGESPKEYHKAVRKLRFIKALLKDSRLKGKFTHRIGALLADEWVGDAGNFPFYSTMAKAVGCKPNAAKSAVEELEWYGWYEVERRHNEKGDSTSNEYTPIFDEVDRVVASKMAEDAIDARKAAWRERERSKQRIGEAVNDNDVIPSKPMRERMATGTYGDDPVAMYDQDEPF